MIWLIGVFIYLAIGISVLFYAVKNDKYGGFILHFGWIVILFWPYLLLRKIFFWK